MDKNTANNPLVSIIVPVYNTHKYIKKCAISLFEQTYDRIEYIFVNDKSTDCSYTNLLEAVSKNQHRICRIIDNEKNLGSSSSRNIGITKAKGDFICFCDSDDWVEPTMIEEMVNKALAENADVVVTPFYTNTFYEEKKVLFSNDEDISDLNNIPISFHYFSLCNKLIRSKFLKDNTSIDGIDCWEDLSITSRIYALQVKVVLLNKPFYHYRKYEYHSLTSSSHERQLEDRLIYANYLTQWFEERKLTERYAQFLNHLKFMSKIKMLRTSPRQFKRWKNTFPESNKYIMTYQDIPLKYRILFYLADKLILK